MERDGRTEFQARIELAGASESSMPARVTVSLGVVTVTASGHQIGSWPLSTIHVSREGSTFVFGVEGERLLVEADDPGGFARAIGIGAPVPAPLPPAPLPVEVVPEAASVASEAIPARSRSTGRHARPVEAWWQFWSAASWRGWWSKRNIWQEFRNAAGPLERDAKGARRRIGERQTALKAAERDLVWAQELRSLDVPIRLARDETALAAFSEVGLLEKRRRENRDVWTPVDSGTVYVTDRRLVFSGRKEVAFEFDKLVASSKASQGLRLAVTSRRRDHILAGPVDHLLVAMEAAEAFGDGLDPAGVFKERVDLLRAGLRTDEDRLAEVSARLAALGAPARPISPGWIPAAALSAVVLVGFALGDDEAGSDSILAADTTVAPSTTTGVSPVTSTTTEVSTSTTLGGASVLGLVLAAPVSGPSGDPAAVPPDGSEAVEVVSITDGDTVDVRLSDGSIDTVRLIGVHAPEAGECMSHVASDVLAVLAPPGSTVHATVDTSDRDQFDRLLRYVWVGSMSVNEELIRRGVAIARRYPPDTALADRFEQAQTAARAEEVGLWAPTACGPVTTIGVGVVGLDYDPPGNDDQALDSEWIRLRNDGAVTVDLTGWTIEDESASHRYDFPSGFALTPGETVTIHTGCGTDFSTDLYWCNETSDVWNNEGDTALLADPSGNIVDTYTYRLPVSTSTTAAAFATRSHPRRHPDRRL